MDNNILLAILTSFAALLVALISGLFAYYANLNTTKVEKLKGYLQFLQHKMDKLEELQRHLKDLDNAKKGVSGVLMYSISIAGDKLRRVSDSLSTYSYLFTHTNAKYERIYDEVMEQEKKWAIVCAMEEGHDVGTNATVISNTNEDKIKLIRDILTSSKEYDRLIVEELAATYQEFQNMSMK